MSRRIDRNRERLQAKLPADIRTDLANKHVDALETMPIPSVKQSLLNRHPYRIMFTSFLAGFDAAMELKDGELLDEHMELHGKIMDMTQAQMIRDGEFETGDPQ